MPLARFEVQDLTFLESGATLLGVVISGLPNR